MLLNKALMNSLAICLVATMQVRAGGLSVVVTFGDSAASQVNTAPKGYYELLREALEKKGGAWEVYNVGGMGFTSSTALSNLRKVLEYKPAITILHLGLGDATPKMVDKRYEPIVFLERFVSNYTAVVRALKASGTRVILATPYYLPWTEETRKIYTAPPFKPGDRDGLNAILVRYVEAIRAIAKSEQVELVDVHDIMRKGNGPAKAGWKFMYDSMRLNAAGHKLIADKLAEVIRKAPPSAGKTVIPGVKGGD